MLQQAFGYSDKIPENVRDAFVWLCQDLTALQSKWDFFVEMYGTKAHTELLSELALASFNMIYDALLNDIIMGISRLTDPAKSARNPAHVNLTLFTLIDMCPDIPGASILQARLKEISELCKPIRHTRNRRVGHRDLKTVITPLDSPLPGISKALIDQFMQSSTDLLNIVFASYDGGQLYFHGGTHGGAESLLFWLNQGKAAVDTARAELLHGGH